MTQKGKRGYTGKARVPKGFARMNPDRLREISRAAIRKRWAAREATSPLEDKIRAMDRMLERWSR